MTKITFEDYLEDIKEVIAECSVPPVLIGFSMGGSCARSWLKAKKLPGWC